MTILTAKSSRVQAYMDPFLPVYKDKSECKKLKNDRLNLFETDMIKNLNLFLTELFTKKQSKVLDHIVYITSVCGISKVSIDTLAKKAKCSRRTVCYAVEKLKETNQYIVARIGDDNAGCYIFVDKLHPNFEEVMKFVFKIDVAASNFDGPVAETCENENVVNESEYKAIELDNTVQEAIKHSIDLEDNTSIEDQEARISEYSTNEYQREFFDYIRSMPKVPSIILNNAYKIALAIGSNATANEFRIACQVIFDIICDFERGRLQVNTSIRALFEHCYVSRLKELETTNTVDFEEDKEELTEVKLSTIPTFYDWLNEREEKQHVQSIQTNATPIYKWNWLEERE